MISCALSPLNSFSVFTVTFTTVRVEGVNCLKKGNGLFNNALNTFYLLLTV